MIGSGKRSDLGQTKSSCPGPGAYSNVDSVKVSHGYSIGKSTRTVERKASVGGTPGPGAYYVPCKVAELPVYVQTNRAKEFTIV